MNFLTVSNQTTGHGSFSRHQRMSQALIHNGHRVFWIAPPGYDYDGVDVLPLSMSWLPNMAFLGLYIKILFTVIKNYSLLKNVDRIFVLREYDAVCFILLPFFRKIPKIFLSRGDSISIYKVNKPDNKGLIEHAKTFFILTVFPLIQKIALQFSDFVVVQAVFLEKLLRERHHDQEFPCFVLKNDCPVYDINCLKRDHFSSNDEVKPINLAFISPFFWECKGLGVIVETIFELEKRNIHYMFHMIGDGPHYNRFSESIANISNSNTKIIWHGWLKDFYPVINDLDLIVVPSLYDSNPNLVLEMISLQKPILASDIACHREMLVNQNLLFPNKNTKELCNKIQTFQKDGHFRSIISSAILERKNKLTFDWDAELVKILEFRQQ